MLTVYNNALYNDDLPWQQVIITDGTTNYEVQPGTLNITSTNLPVNNYTLKDSITGIYYSLKVNNNLLELVPFTDNYNVGDGYNRNTTKVGTLFNFILNSDITNMLSYIDVYVINDKTNESFYVQGVEESNAVYKYNITLNTKGSYTIVAKIKDKTRMLTIYTIDNTFFELNYNLPLLTAKIQSTGYAFI